MNFILFFLIILFSVFIVVSLLFLLPKRQNKLSKIIKDLEQLSIVSPSKDQYAIKENIIFFKSIRHLVSLFKWALFHRPKVKPKQLLEIADLNLPRWENELYENLTVIERRNFPGLTKPLRKLLVQEIKHGGKQVFLDLGCGGMEVERQVLAELRKIKYDIAPIFIGIDSSPQAFASIKKVFSEFGDYVRIVRINNVKDILKAPQLKPTIYFVCGDALKIARELTGRYDLLFSSRFRHHLNDLDKNDLDKIYTEVPYAIEYDDYQTKFSWMPPLITAWNRPILLNGALLSQIRQPRKSDIKKKGSAKGVTIKIFSPPGSYARIFSNKLSWWSFND